MKQESSSSHSTLHPLTLISYIMDDNFENNMAIRTNYNGMNDIVDKTEADFQKLYNAKQKLLLEYLGNSLQKVNRQLKEYEIITSQENIQKLCEQRRKQLRYQRMSLLKQFMDAKDYTAQKTIIVKKKSQQVKQLKEQLSRVESMSSYLLQQNSQLNQKLEQLQNKPPPSMFVTQPVSYISPYSPKILKHKTPTPMKKSKPYKCQSSLLSKLDPVTLNTPQSIIASKILQLPQVRILMLKILQNER